MYKKHLKYPSHFVTVDILRKTHFSLKKTKVCFTQVWLIFFFVFCFCFFSCLVLVFATNIFTLVVFDIFHSWRQLYSFLNFLNTYENLFWKSLPCFWRSYHNLHEEIRQFVPWQTQGQFWNDQSILVREQYNYKLNE